MSDTYLRGIELGDGTVHKDSVSQFQAVTLEAAELIDEATVLKSRVTKLQRIRPKFNFPKGGTFESVVSDGSQTGLPW